MSDISFHIPGLDSDDDRWKSCDLYPVQIPRKENGTLSAEHVASISTMLEFKDMFKAVLEKASYPVIAYEKLVDLPRVSILVADSNPEESSYKVYFLPEFHDDKSSLREAIEFERRVTERNQLRWIFQLFTVLAASFSRFIALPSNVSLLDISLHSDYPKLAAINKWNEIVVHKMKFYKHSLGRNMDLKNVDRDARQVWIEFSPDSMTGEIRWSKTFSELRALDGMLRGGQLNR